MIAIFLFAFSFVVGVLAVIFWTAVGIRHERGDKDAGATNFVVARLCHLVSVALAIIGTIEVMS